MLVRRDLVKIALGASDNYAKFSEHRDLASLFSLLDAVGELCLTNIQGSKSMSFDCLIIVCCMLFANEIWY